LVCRPFGLERGNDRLDAQPLSPELTHAPDGLFFGAELFAAASVAHVERSASLQPKASPLR
jgi:hypothetical protein